MELVQLNGSNMLGSEPWMLWEHTSALAKSEIQVCIQNFLLVIILKIVLQIIYPHSRSWTAVQQ